LPDFAYGKIIIGNAYGEKGTILAALPLFFSVTFLSYSFSFEVVFLTSNERLKTKSSA